MVSRLEDIDLNTLIKYAKKCNNLQETIFKIPKQMVSDGIVENLSCAQAAMLISASRVSLLEKMVSDLGGEFALKDVSIKTFNFVKPEYLADIADFFYMANVRISEMNKQKFKNEDENVNQKS